MIAAIRQSASFLSIVFLLTILASRAPAHIAMTAPAGGRDGPTADDEKFSRPDPNNPAQTDTPGPCGPSTTPNNPRLAYQPGQRVTFNWAETINHPGRFVVQFSPSNLQGFWDTANQLGTLNDANQPVGTPLTMTVTLPTTPCETCALRLLQVMTDQPGQYYVHCVDIRIAAGATPAPTPTGGGNGGQRSSSSNGAQDAPRMGGCGTVDGGGNGGGPTSIVFMAGVFLFALALRLRVGLVNQKS